VSQPLVPLWRHFNVAVEGERAVLHDAPHALLLRGERVAELPEGVAVQVLAWEGGQLGGGKGVERECAEGRRTRTDEKPLPPWQVERFPPVPSLA
jgi:hypothetical protein